MNYILELTREEAIGLNGGGIREIGYAIGKVAANTVDFIEGVADGVIEVFEN